jgi:two-component system phosphate regulon sensor histidine kinase PhoR
MLNKSTVIALLLLLLLITPVVVILLYELNAYDANEHYLQDSYKKQLSTVIYSVNQYSLESANNWGRELESFSEVRNSKKVPRFCLLYSAIRSVFFTDTLFANPKQIYLADGVSIGIHGVSADLRARAKKLPSLQWAGYQKVETGFVPENDSLMFFVYAITPENEPAKLAFILLNRDEYISRLLKPQIQRVAGNFFDIVIFSKPVSDSLAASRILCSTQPGQTFEPENSDRLWLVPDCNIGIKLRTGNISEFVSKRTQTSLLLFGSLFALVSIGAFFMIRSVRKELQVAQMKSDFVANISHEFRTPLSLISMFAETLELGRVKTEEK